MSAIRAMEHLLQPQAAASWQHRIHHAVHVTAIFMSCPSCWKAKDLVALLVNHDIAGAQRLKGLSRLCQLEQLHAGCSRQLAAGAAAGMACSCCEQGSRKQFASVLSVPKSLTYARSKMTLGPNLSQLKVKRWCQALAG